jgi:hypothetical protein
MVGEIPALLPDAGEAAPARRHMMAEGVMGAKRRHRCWPEADGLLSSG